MVKKERKNKKPVDLSTLSVFTTGQTAEVCQVSQQTIIRCFDEGILKGFRVPGSKFRRIPREALYRFMLDNGIPMDILELRKRTILVLDSNDHRRSAFIQKLAENEAIFEGPVLAESAFQIGWMVSNIKPDVAIIDASCLDVSGAYVAARIQNRRIRGQDDRLVSVHLVIIDEANKLTEVQKAGADKTFPTNVGFDQLFTGVCDLLQVSVQEGQS